MIHWYLSVDNLLQKMAGVKGIIVEIYDVLPCIKSIRASTKRISNILIQSVGLEIKQNTLASQIIDWILHHHQSILSDFHVIVETSCIVS